MLDQTPAETTPGQSSGHGSAANGLSQAAATIHRLSSRPKSGPGASDAASPTERPVAHERQEFRGEDRVAENAGSCGAEGSLNKFNYQGNTVSGDGKAHFGNVYNYPTGSHGDALRLLEPVGEARWDSQHNEGRHRHCLAGTRLEVLAAVDSWAQDTNSSPIFWLSGIAGTGKSTLAMTLASRLQSRYLTSSFFFDRSSTGLGTARRMLPSLAHQLALQSPLIKERVLAALGDEPEIARLSTRRQLKDLIRGSCNAVPDSRIILVIDALDECKDVGEVTRFLQQVSKTEELSSPNLRILLTSRPDWRIESSFREISTCHELVLHETSRGLIDRDIQAYFENEMADIRRQRSLPAQWPSRDHILSLVRRSEGLFMFAAIVCNYVNGTTARSPVDRLRDVLQHTQGPQDATKALDRMYTLILLEAFRDDYQSHEQAAMRRDFREIIGSLVISFESLSLHALADLIKVDLEALRNTLIPLRAVIYVTKDDRQMVRIIHESFRDYLLDDKRCSDLELSVDAGDAHLELAMCSLTVMEEQLRVDTCGLRFRSRPQNWSVEDVNVNISPTLRYACRYWMRHVAKATKPCYATLEAFLRHNALMWMEALGLMQAVAESISALIDLEMSVDSDDSASSTLSTSIYDLRRFITAHQDGITEDPLQVYFCARYFTPSSSPLRFVTHSLSIGGLCAIVSTSTTWDDSHGLEDDMGATVRAVSFSPDGSLMAVAAGDTAAIWETSPFRQIHKLEGHDSDFGGLAFSPDGVLLACSAQENTINLWSTFVGELRCSLQGHQANVLSIAFNKQSSKLVASALDSSIRIWDVLTGTETLVICPSGDRSHFRPVFALHEDSLAAANSGNVVTMWSLRRNRVSRNLHGHAYGINDLIIAPDGSVLASASFDQTVRVWELDSGQCLYTFGPHLGSVTSLAFSADSTIIAACSRSKIPSSEQDCHHEIKLWSRNQGHCLQTFTALGSVMSLHFTEVGNLLLCKTYTHGVEVRNVGSGFFNNVVQILRKPYVLSISVAPNQLMVATGYSTGGLRVTEIAPARARSTAAASVAESGLDSKVSAMGLAPGGEFIATGYEDGSIRIWDMQSGHNVGSATGHNSPMKSLDFSADAGRLATITANDVLQVWERTTCTILNQHDLNSMNFPVRPRPKARHRSTASRKDQEPGSLASSATIPKLSYQRPTEPFAGRARIRSHNAPKAETSAQTRHLETADESGISSISSVKSNAASLCTGVDSRSVSEHEDLVERDSDLPQPTPVPGLSAVSVNDDQLAGVGAVTTADDDDYDREVRWTSQSTIECRGRDSSSIILDTSSNTCYVSPTKWKTTELRKPVALPQDLTYTSGWIKFRDRNLLWIPHAYRPAKKHEMKAWRGYKDSILIHSRSGKHTFVKMGDPNTWVIHTGGEEPRQGEK
ncbi:Vegetative incompatibility protein HET-E-1 [Pseudocercospora fuligena]|uniref:Vegetative incompatibility protein HET-E-1 n=1 Tax=Pseudocercospora fuligena TaxID=685502 RepID=A0A8H6RN72_9PEZI|nr:Vegetative incompatibility protein HET-E-1 [Pseudocercospora fuligena]